MGEDADSWVPLAEAAQLSGRHPDTIRRQIRAGVLEVRKDNQGRWEVRRTKLGDLSGRKAPPYASLRSAAQVPVRDAAQADAELVQRLREEVGFLRAELERARAEHRTDLARLLAAAEQRAKAEAAGDGLRQRVEQLHADRDRELAEMKAALERERALAEAERERVDRLLAALADRRERRPWPGLKAWWRRLIEGGG